MSTEDLLRRVPPQNIEAEESVLGAIFLANPAIDEILDVVRVDDFYRESHRLIFQAMVDLRERHEPIDAITMTDVLRDRKVLEQVGGPHYLAELAARVPTAANGPYYAKIVRDKALLRRIIQVATEIAAEGYEQADAEAFADSAARRITEVCEPRAPTGRVHIGEILPMVVRNVEQMVEDRRSVTGLSTGLADLDEITTGLQPADLVILAARPGMGKKSALAGNIALYAAMHERKHVTLFSLEMSKEQLVLRMACSEAGLDLDQVRRGILSKEKLHALGIKAAEISASAELWIDESSDITALALRARCRRQKRAGGLDLVLVDYLQLVRPADQGVARRPSWRNREQEVAEISKSLKGLAKELRIPVVALSQLNRQVETRSDRRPGLADLRESGAIEQDADVIVFLYRDDVYNKDSPDVGTAELIVAKQRNGVADTAKVTWLPQYCKFVNYSSKEDEF